MFLVAGKIADPIVLGVISLRYGFPLCDLKSEVAVERFSMGMVSEEGKNTALDLKQ